MQGKNPDILSHNVLAYIRMWTKNTMTKKILASTISLWSSILQIYVQYSGRIPFCYKSTKILVGKHVIPAS